MSAAHSSESARQRCAYLVGRYPSPTHTFILNEVRTMRGAGVDIETISLHRTPPETLLSGADREAFEQTFTLRPVTPWRLARLHARALSHAPLAYLRTLASALRDSPGGARATLWQLFYFAESMLLWARLDTRAPRHIHVHHANVASDLAMLACRFANGATRKQDSRRWTWSLTVHGPDDFADMRGRKLALKAREAQAVICVSEFGRRQLLGVVDDAAHERVHTIHCGVDLERFRPRSRPSGQAATASVLTVAQLVRRKGIDVLLDAIAQLRARDVDVGAVVVGEGEERASLEARARDLGLEAAVTFAGAIGQDRIFEHYSRADIFCLASFAEGIPIVLMEAMAQELPVVATSVMGVPELVVDRRCGLLVPPGRSDLLANALEELARDPALRQEVGRGARERVAASFELHDVVEQLLEVLRPLLAGGDARASGSPAR